MRIKGILKAYPTAIAASLAIIVFLSLSLWRNSVFADLKENMAQRETEAERLATNVHNAQKLDAQLEQMAALNRKISTRLSSPTDVAGNQQYFYKLESDSGVKLLDLNQSGYGSKGLKKNTLTQYTTVAYSASVQGDYIHVIGFLRNLESGSRITAITGGELAATASGRTQDEAGATTTLLLTLNIQLLGTL